MNMHERIEHNICLMADEFFEGAVLIAGKDGFYQSYMFSHDNKPELKKKWLSNPEKFQQRVHHHLVNIFSNTESQAERGHFSCVKLFNMEMLDMFQTLIGKSELSIFKHMISAFEKLVNSSGFLGNTNFYRSFILRILSENHINPDEEKINFVLNSLVLNKEDNLCDKEISNFKDSFKFEAADFYTYYISSALILMTSLSDKGNISKIYPDGQMTRINVHYVAHSAEGLFLKNTNLDINLKDIFINKFGVEFFKKLQAYYDKNIFKDSIHELIKDEVSLDDKKDMLLLPLVGKLNLRDFNYINKKYPEVLSHVSEKDVEQHSFFLFPASMPGSVNRNSSLKANNKKNNNIEKIKEKYGITHLDYDIHTIKNNILKIIKFEQAVKEKKVIKKTMNIKKSEVTTKRRI